MSGAPQTPLPQDTAARRFIAVPALLVGTLLLAALNVWALQRATGGGLMLTVSLVAATVPAVFYAMVIILLDRYEAEPKRLLAAAFFWGAVIATGLSIVGNLTFALAAYLIAGERAAEQYAAVVGAPIVEELAKGAVLFILFWRLPQEFDNVLDGIVYGALVGVGFAMTENALYFGRAFQEGMGAGLFTIYLREILGGFGHPAYTATVGAALGWAQETAPGRRRARITIPLVGLFLAVLQHGTWNLLAGDFIRTAFATAAASQAGLWTTLLVIAPAFAAVLLAPGLLTLLVLVGVAWRREARIIREELREEVSAGVLTKAEYARLTSHWRRLGAEVGAFLERDVSGWVAALQFHHTATDLAFRKWHLRRSEAPKGTQKVVPEDAYHRRLGALRLRFAPLAPSLAVPPQRVP